MSDNKGKANVTVLEPVNVPSMKDERQNGKVDQAVEAALQTLRPFDSDGHVPLESYDTDLLGALTKATEVADKSDGIDLIAIVTDLVTDNRDEVETALDQLVADGNGVILVVVNDQPNDDLTAWGEKLDGDGRSDKLDRVDVLSVDELPGTEVQGWFK